MARLTGAGETCGVLYGRQPRTQAPQPQSRMANTGEDMARFREAAERGDAAAQFDLGEAYETGDGVLQDDARAYERKMSADTIAEAQERALEWMRAFELRSK